MYDATATAMGPNAMGPSGAGSNAGGYGAEAGYAAVARSTATGRSAEAKVFARVTAQLTAAAKSGDTRKTADALFKNNQLWTVIAADVASEENTLAPDLRARLFYLGEFTQAHSRKILLGEAEIADLIDINKAVMRGLMGQPETLPETLQETLAEPAETGQEARS